MEKVVVDSSVIVKWVNSKNELLLEEADFLMKKVQSGKVYLVASELSKFEAGNAILNKGMELSQAFGSASTLDSLPITFVAEDEDLAHIALEVAQTYKITYYDATPVALAIREKASLITDNFKHQGKVKEVTVVPLKDLRL